MRARRARWRPCGTTGRSQRRFLPRAFARSWGGPLLSCPCLAPHSVVAPRAFFPGYLLARAVILARSGEQPGHLSLRGERPSRKGGHTLALASRVSISARCCCAHQGRHILVIPVAGIATDIILATAFVFISVVVVVVVHESVIITCGPAVPLTAHDPKAGIVVVVVIFVIVIVHELVVGPRLTAPRLSESSATLLVLIIVTVIVAIILIPPRRIRIFIIESATPCPLSRMSFSASFVANASSSGSSSSAPTPAVNARLRLGELLVDRARPLGAYPRAAPSPRRIAGRTPRRPRSPRAAAALRVHRFVGRGTHTRASPTMRRAARGPSAAGVFAGIFAILGVAIGKTIEEVLRREVGQRIATVLDCVFGRHEQTTGEVLHRRVVMVKHQRQLPGRRIIHVLAGNGEARFPLEGIVRGLLLLARL